MMRALALLLLAAGFALAPTHGAEAQLTSLNMIATLKRAVTVDSEVVRIGDLIDNAGAVAHVPIFRAPDIGTTGVVPTTQVLAAIRAHDLFAIDTRHIAEVEVTRAGRTITAAEIEAKVLHAFAGQYGLGEAKNLTVTFDRAPSAFAIEPAVAADLQLVRSAYDSRTRRFDLQFELPGSAVARRAPLRYSGTMVEIADVAVLTRALQRGETVRASDVAVERRPRSEVTPEHAVRADQVIGLAAKQALRGGQPLRRIDLVRPEMVKRDETITLIYEVPGILLTTRGKALEAGAEGEIVSVLNIQSKRTVQGVVTGVGQVTIAATPVATRTASAEMPDAGSSAESK
jgi:flagella basal body P-ring formation protein FlgA